MKIPQTPDDLKKEFYISVDLLDKIGDLRIRQLMERLTKVSDDIIVLGIIKIFENTERPNTQYVDQEYAGKILEKLKPKANIDLGLVLKSTIQNWNKSVEQFPFWLKENCGIDELKDKLAEFENQNPTELESDKLKSFKWWLNV